MQYRENKRYLPNGESGTPSGGGLLVAKFAEPGTSTIEEGSFSMLTMAP